jgi:transcriptional regulator with XRE-family HTH domain
MTKQNKSTQKNITKKTNWFDQFKDLIKSKNYVEYSSKIALKVGRAIQANPELTQSKLAEEIGVSKQYVSKLLKGYQNLTLDTIAKLECAIGIKLIEIPYSAAEKAAVYFETTNQEYRTSCHMPTSHIISKMITNNTISYNQINVNLPVSNKNNGKIFNEVNVPLRA